MKRIIGFISKNTETSILWGIIAIAAIMRFLLVWDLSLSPVELSLLEKVDTGGISALFNANDYISTFPSGFLFFQFLWIKITFSNEILLRIPSIALSVASVYLTFLIAKHWFNSQTGLMSAALLAVLQFPILYAQQALPYSFGLFFVLLAILFWWKALFNNPENNRKPFLYFALILAITGYFQSFALIGLLVIVISGFFFTNKANFKNYIVAIIIAAVIYQPQFVWLMKNLEFMNISESGAWIIKPESNMFFKFIYYSLNQSQFLIYALFVFLVYSNIESFGTLKYNRFHVISIVLLIVPLGFAFFFSIYKSPFIENPIFLFLLPFILMLTFSCLNPERKRINYSALAILMAIGIFSTIAERKYYNDYHYAETKNIAEKYIEYNNLYGGKNISAVANLKSKFNLEFYLNKTGNSNKFLQYKNDGHKDLLTLSKIVVQCQTPYFLEAWSGVFNPHETEDIISTKYPYIIEKIDYNGLAGITLYSQTDNKKTIKKKTPVYYDFNGFETGNMWDKDTSMLSTEIVKYDKHSLIIRPKDVYGPSCTNIFSRMCDKPIKNIRVSMWAYCKDIPKDAQIVATISFKDEDNQIFENYFWLSSKLEYFVEQGKWGQAFFSFNLPALKSINDELKIYVWNPDKNTIFIDNFELKAFTEE